jgi:two-component system chemotaxis response regulator CheB
MESRDIIVVAASAGGVRALVQMVRGLPPGLPASLFVVSHFPPGSRSVLPEILSRSGPLLAEVARDGEPFYPGQIYTAPPDHHLLLAPGGRLELSHGPRENRHRPAADPLFRSAGRHYGRRVIGVVLTGSLCDGTAGLLAVRAAGGLAIVQDPGDAAVASMPQNAKRIAGCDFLVRAADLSRVLADQVHGTSPDAGGQDAGEAAPEMPDGSRAAPAREEGREGGISPAWGEVLGCVDDPPSIPFGYHVGRPRGTEAEQMESLEAALWTAVRTFKENVFLARQLATLKRARGDDSAAARFDEQADQADRYGDLIRQCVINLSAPRPAPWSRPPSRPNVAAAPGSEPLPPVAGDLPNG